MLRPDGIASPTPARAFTFELSPPGSPLGGVEYHYAGKQLIPAAGLTPARQATVWAARRGAEGKARKTVGSKQGAGSQGIRTIIKQSVKIR